MSLLYGIHDREGRHIVPAGGFCVDTVALSENPAPTDYAALRADINWIVRLNWGYGTTGTIPLPHQFDYMVTAAAAYVHNSRGASRFIIGNEPQHENERPNGVFITPEQYARCFLLCRAAIKLAESSAQVIPAPCAPYHANPVDWLAYWREMLGIIAANGGCDGIAVHAYTRSSDPNDINDDVRMGPPLENQSAGFLVYQDALTDVPATLRHLPAYITEFNELLPGGWHDANTGVVQEAYSHINWWNTHGAEDGDPKVQCLILYRWPKYDKWHIEGKQGVIDDFRAAVAKGYTSPTGTEQQMQTVHIPAAPSLPPREVDPRAEAKGTHILDGRHQPPGQQYWRVKRLYTPNEDESDQLGPDRHILANVIVDGKRQVDVPLLVTWGNGGPDERATIRTKQNDQYAFSADHPLTPGEFSLMVDDGKPSEIVRGIAMGVHTPQGWNPGAHTSTLVDFELVTAPTVAVPAQPALGSGPQSALTTLFVSVSSGANIRQAPAVEATKLGAAPLGARLTVLSATPNRDWVQVRWGDISGWVLASLLSTVEPVTQPAPAGDPARESNWARSYAFTAKWEGGYQNIANDRGNWTGGAVGVGENKGTNFGISAASYPHLDIKNLTREQAEAIYRNDYWGPSGASALPWPACLIVFDTAVLHGVGTAKAWQAEVGTNALAFAAKRLRVYTKMSNWDTWGKGWINRVAELLLEATRP